MKRVLVAVAAIALGAAAFLPTQALAEVGVNIVIGNAPPPVRYEVVPAPRRGYEWAPGYWNWSGRRHEWSQGHWEQSRPGYVYQRSEWRQDGDRWQLNRGGWTTVENRDTSHRREHWADREDGRGRHDGYRDRDHDGVPNRHDRDRDGDGVPNRYDRRPDNPYKY